MTLFQSQELRPSTDDPLHLAAYPYHIEPDPLHRGAGHDESAGGLRPDSSFARGIPGYSGPGFQACRHN